MAREGATVVLTDVLDKVHDTMKDIKDHGYKVISFKMDVTKSADVNQVVQKVLEQFGKVDILVNNAGISEHVRFIDMTEELWDETFEVNIKGVFRCTKAVLPSMIKRKYGKIINISSVTGPLVVDIGLAAYASAKGAVWAFTRALALEVAKYGINVNAVCPGTFDTELVRKSVARADPKHLESVIEQMTKEIPMGRLGRPEEIGEVVAFLASDKSRYMTGTPVIIDGGSTLPESRFTPDEQI